MIQAAAAEASKEAAAAASTADQKLREAENATAAMQSRLDQQGAELVSARLSAENTAKAGLLPSTLTTFCPYAMIASGDELDDAAMVSCFTHQAVQRARQPCLPCCPGGGVAMHLMHEHESGQ